MKKKRVRKNPADKKIYAVSIKTVDGDDTGILIRGKSKIDVKNKAKRLYYSKHYDLDTLEIYLAPATMQKGGKFYVPEGENPVEKKRMIRSNPVRPLKKKPDFKTTLWVIVLQHPSEKKWFYTGQTFDDQAKNAARYVSSAAAYRQIDKILKTFPHFKGKIFAVSV